MILMADQKSRYIDLAAIALVVIEFLLIYSLYVSSSISIIDRVAFGIISLVFVGIVISRVEGLEGSFGLYMIGSKRGIKTINSIAKRYKRFWKAMADWGIVLGFGLASYLILGKRVSKLTYVFGILTIIFTVLFVVPYTAYGLQFIKVQQLQLLGYSAGGISSFFNLSLVQTLYLVFVVGITVIFGFTGYIFYALIDESISIVLLLISIVGKALSGAPSLAPLSTQVPGLLPVIPGITIPLISGLIAFIIIVVIHEMSHGVLASMVKTKIKRVGLLIFGVIPIGAFVEPDDKMIEKLDRHSKNRIYSAGVSANFIAMFIFFFLLLLVLPYVNSNIIKVAVSSTIPGYPASNVIAPGSIILSWNGHPTNNIGEIDAASANDTPGKVVTIATNMGNYSLVAQRANGTTRGLVGVDIIETPVIKGTANSIIYFLYSLFAITLMLNFLIGVINLLPLPMLDGSRIYDTSITKRKWIIKALDIAIVAMLILIALPWLGGLHV